MAGDDKLPVQAAEIGTYSTSAPDPHIDLSGSAVDFGTVMPTRTFADAAGDTSVDFNTGDTCQVMIVYISNKNIWAVYSGVTWTDAATDTLDLSTATLEASEGTLLNSYSVNCWALPPFGRYMPDTEGASQGDPAQVNASGNWTV